MSFIYNDKKLIEKLIKAGIGVSSVAPGIAGTSAKIGIELAEEGKQSLELAKKLIANLQDQLSGKAIFSAEREDAQLFPKHVENLNKLVNFLSLNGIKYNSMLISLDVGESALAKKSGEVYYAGLDEIERSKYAQYLTDNNGKPLYYVYKDGLIAYLKDLLSKGNEILNVMLQKIIDEANQVLKLNIPKELPKQDAPKQEGPVQPGKQNPQAPQTQPALSNESFSEIIRYLPFKIDDIDFNRIGEFFESYKRVLTSSSSQGRSIPISGSINNAFTAMGVVANNTSSNIRVFNISNLNVKQVILWTKAPQGQHIRLLLGALIDVIFQTSMVVQDLYNTYFSNDNRKVQGSNYDAYKNLVYQQLHIYQSNNSKLREVLDDLPK